MHVINRAWQILLLVGAASMLLGLFSIFRVNADDIPSVAQCSSSARITSPSNGSNIEGMVQTRIADSGVNPQPDFVELYIGDEYIGDAIDKGTFWERTWHTSGFPSGSDELVAVFFDETSTDDIPICVTAGLPVNVVGGAGSTGDEFLDVTILMDNQPFENWVGPTNFPKSISAKAFLIDGPDFEDVTDDANFDWSISNVGSITSNGQYATFASGPIPGEGEITVHATFDGYQAFDSVNTLIQPSTVGTNFPTPDNDTNNDPQEVDPNKPQRQQQGQNSTQTQHGDPELEDCLIEVIGNDTYNDILSNNGRLSFDQLVASHYCFAESRYVVPSNLAPVNPADMEGIKEDNRLLIRGIEQGYDEENTPNGLVLSGAADPDKKIMIYIFSEPMVLTTETDSEGNWTYTIEDPMAPGEHTAYIAVEDDNGEFVRSSSFIFSVAQAASTEDNPNGLSLQLTGTTERSYAIFFLVGSIIVFVAFLVFMLIVRRKVKSAKKYDENHGLTDNGVPGSPPNISPEA